MDDEKDALAQISSGHQTMMNVLESRKIKVNAAMTFWDNKEVTQLIKYLIRMNDESLYVDILPYISWSINEGNEIGKKVTLENCMELFPALQLLLKAKFEDYVIVSLDFVRILCHRWYRDLKEVKQKQDGKDVDLNDKSISLPDVYLQLLSLQRVIMKQGRRTGKIGERAKIIHQILEELT